VQEVHRENELRIRRAADTPTGEGIHYITGSRAQSWLFSPENHQVEWTEY